MPYFREKLNIIHERCSVSEAAGEFVRDSVSIVLGAALENAILFGPENGLHLESIHPHHTVEEVNGNTGSQ